jgi:hypothetical protein
MSHMPPTPILSYKAWSDAVLCQPSASGIRIEIRNTRPDFWRLLWLAPFLVYPMALILLAQRGGILPRPFSAWGITALACGGAFSIELLIESLIWLLIRRGSTVLELDRTGMRAWNLVGIKKAEWPLLHPLKIRASTVPFFGHARIKIRDGYFVTYATNGGDCNEISRAVASLNAAIAELRKRSSGPG